MIPWNPSYSTAVDVHRTSKLRNSNFESQWVEHLTYEAQLYTVEDPAVGL